MVTDGIAQKRFEELRRIFTAGKASHAYLFLGSVNQENEDGIQGLAQILLCQAEGEKPCGTCRACRLLTGGSHPDFRVIAPEGGKIKLEEIRQLCYDAVLNPYLSPCKVYLFKRFETLTEVAANAFLKTLEEPPSYALFILATTEKHKVLPTVLSRCQVFDFNRISIKAMTGKLAEVAKKEGVAVEQDSLHVMAQKADGAMRDALTLLDQCIAVSGKEITDRKSVV